MRYLAKKTNLQNNDDPLLRLTINSIYSVIHFQSEHLIFRMIVSRAICFLKKSFVFARCDRRVLAEGKKSNGGTSITRSLITWLDPRLISKFNRNLPTLSRDNASYDSFPSRASAKQALLRVIDIYDCPISPPPCLSFFSLCDRTTEITRRNHSTVACALACLRARWMKESSPEMQPYWLLSK